MRLIDKYLLRSFLAPLLYGLCIFVSVYIVIDLFANLPDIIKQRIGMDIMLVYYLAYIPTICVQVMPMTILVSTMFTMGSLAGHNEIIALRSSGISIWEILKPFLITAMLIALFIIIINDRLVPKTTQLYQKIREEKFDNKKSPSKGASAKVIRNVALYGFGNKIVYARSYDPNTKVLKDVIVQEHDRRQNVISKTTAKEARWTGNSWVAFNITSYKLDAEGEIKEEPKFRHRDTLDLKEGPDEFQRQRYKTELLTIAELKTSIKKLSGTSGVVIQNLRIEAYNRIAYPFANVVAVLIGAAFCIRSKRGGRLLGIGLGSLIGFLFYGVLAVSVALGKGGVLPPFIAVWFPDVSFGLLGFYLINRF